jgi:DNA-directed RNA polymerase subunit RPC12/RpoP
MPETKLTGYKCNVCGHQWVPRSKLRPVRCAGVECRSPYWDRPKQEKEMGLS